MKIPLSYRSSGLSILHSMGHGILVEWEWTTNAGEQRKAMYS